MAREIERKYLVTHSEWKALAFQKTHFAQGYLNDIQNKKSKSSVRVRIEGDSANINIKSLEIGISRDEYEYPIAVDDAKKMLSTLSVGPVIEKIRYLVKYEEFIWEIDEFLADNDGLIVAEVELDSETTQPILPAWIGKEVTELSRYYNVSLSEHPYSQWSEDEKK